MKKAKLILPIAASILITCALLCLFSACSPSPSPSPLSYVPRTEPTCVDGNTEYWYQASTGKYYSDPQGLHEINASATVLPGTGHTYGSWEKGTDPTIYKSGTLIRTCDNDTTHVEICELPPLDAKNGYKVSDTDGTKTLTPPTFTTSGGSYFSIRKANQVFTYKATLPNLKKYYSTRTDTVLVPVDNMSYTGSGASYNSEAKTILLNSNTDTVSFTLTAPEDGLYAVYLKYANKANARTMMSVYNDSVTEWTAYAHTLIAESEKTTNMTYELRTDELRRDFPAKECTVVYLQKGENRIRFVFDKPIGISDALFVQKHAFREGDNSILHPYGEGENNNNGYKFNEGQSLDIAVTAPANGTYKLYALISTTGGSYTLSSENGSFPTRRLDIPERQGHPSLSGMDKVRSTYLYELTELSLTAGTHTLHFALEEDGDTVSDYLHMNFLACVRVGDIKPEERLTVDLTRSPDPTSGSVSLSLHVSGLTADGDQSLTAVIEGYYTSRNGSETPFSAEFSKTDYNQSFSYETSPLSGDLDGVSYRVKLYSTDKTSLLYEGRLFHYALEDTLTIYMVTDIHHTGSNLSQLIRKYHYPENHQWAWSENVLKTYNSNSTACDIYGITTDEKAQRIMDDIIERYEAGEFDIVFFLGDQSMNDGNYRNFAPDHIMYQGSKYGQSLEEFWTSPLNLDLIMTEQYFSQLAEHDIPVFCAVGNHDYIMDYNDAKTAIDHTQHENMYHYQELFGHKDADGHIYDATPVDFFIRVIRRDGEVKIVSALSSEELRAFKRRNANTWNSYDCYVSEDTLSDTDIRLGGLMMVAPYQIESFDYYMRYYVYMKDPETGEADYSVKDYHGQTYRSDYHTMDVIEEMTPMVEEFSSVFLFAHNYCDDIGSYLAKHDNIRGLLMGDLHTQTSEEFLGLAPRWVCGACVGSFDVSYYYERDPETGELTKTADKQYWNKNSQAVNNGIAGNFVEYPYSAAMLHIRGTESYMEREHISFFYENTQPAYNIMFNKVVGWDPMYERAVDYTKEAGTTFKVGDRTVYVGGDTFIVGDSPSYINIARSYTKLAYNTPEYILAPESGKTYTVCDTAGRPVNENGKPVVINGGTALTVTLPSTEEGTAFTLFGQTYYTISKSGGVVGHYLYDENGDFVYVDQNGNLVFYDFYKDANCDFMLEYFYEDENGGFVPLGYWNEDHTVYTLYNGSFTHEGGSYTDENGVIQTTAGIWLSGDTLTISRLDYTHNDTEQLKQVVNTHSHCQYKVTKAEILIQNGYVIRGEGFMHKSYTYRFTDAYGNEVDKSTVKRTQDKTWTYELVDKAGYTPGASLSATSFTVTQNSMQDIYGMYIPRESYEMTWLTR